MICHLCEDQLICPIHDAEEYAAAVKAQEERTAEAIANIRRGIFEEPIPRWATALAWLRRKAGR